MDNSYRTVKSYKIKRDKEKSPKNKKSLEDYISQEELSQIIAEQNNEPRTTFTEKDAPILDGMVSEYFDAFVILGIDTKGEGHIVKKLKSFIHKAGLHNLVDILINMEINPNLNEDDENY